MAEIRRVLVLGAKGTLGGQLMRLYPEAIGWDREDVDVLDPAALRSRLDGLGFVPLAVLNCVAFNDVDGAEDHPERAFALNAEFPGRLAQWTREKGVPLVHYSTNYVFDGARGEYRESDAPAPLSAYGMSKWRGEQLVAGNGGQWYVVRTAVIFGPKGASELSKKSFVDIMVDLAAKRDSIEAVADEVNSVTYAVDLAAGTRSLLEAAPAAGDPAEYATAAHAPMAGRAGGFPRVMNSLAAADGGVWQMWSHPPGSNRRPTDYETSRDSQILGNKGTGSPFGTPAEGIAAVVEQDSEHVEGRTPPVTTGVAPDSGSCECERTLYVGMPVARPERSAVLHRNPLPSRMRSSGTRRTVEAP